MGNAQIKSLNGMPVIYTVLNNPNLIGGYILKGNFMLDLNELVVDGGATYAFDIWNETDNGKQYHVIGVWDATFNNIPNQFLLSELPYYYNYATGAFKYAQINDILSARTDTLTMTKQI